MRPMTPVTSTQLPQYFDFGKYLLDLKERFARNVWKLGNKNTVGSKRYIYEVDFAYLIDEIERGSTYLRGKAFERANSLVNAMFTDTLKKPS